MIQDGYINKKTKELLVKEDLEKVFIVGDKSFPNWSDAKFYDNCGMNFDAFREENDIKHILHLFGENFFLFGHHYDDRFGSCIIYRAEVRYLRFVISENGIFLINESLRAVELKQYKNFFNKALINLQEVQLTTTLYNFREKKEQ